jgi:hypothetical protein
MHEETRNSNPPVSPFFKGGSYEDKKLERKNISSPPCENVTFLVPLFAKEGLGEICAIP